MPVDSFRPSTTPDTSRQDQPLGLTVHDIPPLSAAAPTAAGRWKMLGILLVCASPVIASYLTYYVVRPEGRRNYGELITPQRMLPAVSALSTDGSAYPLTALKDQWLLVSVSGGACEAVCQKNLYFQRQLRESLGREKDRLDWLVLFNDDIPVSPALAPALKDANVLRVPARELGQWLEAEPGQSLTAHLYLVDPLGHWMMRFPANMDAPGAAKAKQDLERLLRASGSWDKPGRLPAKAP